MNANIKLLLEESLKLERLVNIKTTLLKLPVNILTNKEIKEIKKIFKDFTTRLDRLMQTFLDIKEQKLSQNRKLDDNEQILEKQFEDIKQKDNAIKDAIDYLSNEFELIKEEETKYLSRNRRLGTKFEDSSVSDSRSDRSDVGDLFLLSGP